MKTTLALFVAFVLMFVAGCDMHYEQPVHTYFPTNHWTVKSVVEGEVVAETLSTNLAERFRVVKAAPVTPLTNGQSVRVELTLRQGPHYRLELVSARAYPAVE